jgi:hypothetical protein
MAAISFLARAQAATELCGAHLRPMVAVPSTDPQAPQVYSYVLQALSQRSTEGGIVADTDHGWFEWAFANTPLVAHADRMNISGVVADGKDYESAPLYVAFPAGTIVRHAWVERAQTRGEGMFDYDTRGMQHCFVPELAAADVHAPIASPSPAPDLAARATVATPTVARFDPQCSEPFTTAWVSRIPRVNRPDDYSGPNYAATISIVAISSESKVLDVWTVGSSGNQRYDIAVRNALLSAKYRAPLSYCMTVDTLLYVVEAFR